MGLTSNLLQVKPLKTLNTSLCRSAVGVDLARPSTWIQRTTIREAKGSENPLAPCWLEFSPAARPRMQLRQDRGVSEAGSLRHAQTSSRVLVVRTSGSTTMTFGSSSKAVPPR
jgi:hypothetical protein